jgi:hypothetical protein
VTGHRTPRQWAVARYARRYDHLAELGQELVGKGQYDDAESVHNMARIVVRAYSAEDYDPAPQTGATVPCCLTCAAYIAAPAILKLVPLDEAML